MPPRRVDEPSALAALDAAELKLVEILRALVAADARTGATLDAAYAADLVARFRKQARFALLSLALEQWFDGHDYPAVPRDADVAPPGAGPPKSDP